MEEIYDGPGRADSDTRSQDIYCTHRERHTHTHIHTAAAAAGHFCNETFPGYMVTATLWCPQMFTFKDIMYKVVSDILKGADLDHLLWTDSTHSQYVAHRMLRSKRLQQMLLLLFLCAFPATWHTKSNFKKVQMVEIWTLTCNNSMVIYVTRCVQCLSLFLSGRADIKSERLNGRRKKSAWQRGAEVSLPPYLCFFFLFPTGQ